jgi:hypothetical protein
VEQNFTPDRMTAGDFFYVVGGVEMDGFHLLTICPNVEMKKGFKDHSL